MKKLVIIISIMLLICSSFAFSAEKPKLYTGENVLVCANYNDGPNSSDMSLIVQLESEGTFFVNEGNNVKYIIPDNDIKGFTELKFDDSKWKDGISGVGYGDTDDNTVVPNGTILVYTRYKFIVKNANAIKSLIFRADYDDQYIAWLNGIEISRSNGIISDEPIPTWNIGVIRGGSIVNHGATELVAGKPNVNRKYQVEAEVEFMPSAVVKSLGNLTTSWGRIKQN